jgi:hypothetical protein
VVKKCAGKPGQERSTLIANNVLYDTAREGDVKGAIESMKVGHIFSEVGVAHTVGAVCDLTLGHT